MDKKWQVRIHEATNRGQFTDEDRALAKNFKTCVVGEYYPSRWKRLGWGEWDRGWRLNQLGYDFYQAVRNEDMAEAETIRREIDKGRRS